jgi:hypothetical protein
MNPGSATGWSLLARGTGPNTSGRWGDYFGAARDPSEPSRVWITGQLGSAAAGPGGWETTVAALAAAPFTIFPPTQPTPPPTAVDTAPPTVRALAGSARRGALAKLRYRIWENSTETREAITIRRGGKVLASKSTAFGDVISGDLYYAEWRVPKKLRPGRLRFCVVSNDRTGNRSDPACASLLIK